MLADVMPQLTEKLNYVNGVKHKIEEEVFLTNGVYAGDLLHDNIDEGSISIFTEKNFGGQRITNYGIANPPDTPWRTRIRVLANYEKLYISYTTSGDTVEAEDINVLQDCSMAIAQYVDKYQQATDEKMAQIENSMGSGEIIEIETSIPDIQADVYDLWDNIP